MLWYLALVTVMYLISGVVLLERTRAARRSTEAYWKELTRATAEVREWKARAHEYNALWLEERALTRELLAAPRMPTRAAPDSEPAEDESGDPMTVGQADMLVVEAERRRREREAAERARRASEGDEDDEPEAPDLTGLEPVPIADERAMPVNRLTESVGGEDDDES